MPVPENIRKVARPKNTVVVNNGKPGPNQYAVRARKTEKYIDCREWAGLSLLWDRSSG